MKLSVVTTLYRSSLYINEFHQRVTASARALAGDDYEIIFVNDGSPDNSLEVAVKLTETDGHVSVIDLSRNFGHHKAIMTGLAHSKGELVFLIDSDLEEEPEWMSLFHQQMEARQCDVVYGVQEKRKGGVFERISGGIFYQVFNFLSDVKIPTNLLTVRLMTRNYVEELLRYGESQMQFSVISELAGFSQVAMPVKKLSTSPTTYSLRSKFSHLVNAITSSSSRPLYYIFLLGLLITIISFLYIGNIVVQSILHGTAVNGWASLIVSIWLLGGLNLICLGIVGLYVAKVFLETKNRPYTHVRKIWRKK